MAGRDFLSDDSFVRDVSVEMTKPQGETTWFVSYPERTDINLSKVPSCALCLTAAIHEQLALSVHKNGALTCLQCTSRLRPESPLTDKWQQRVSRCFAHSVRKKTHRHKSHTKSQKNDFTLNTLLFTNSCVPLHLCGLRDGLSDKWQQRPDASSHLCLSSCITAVTLLSLVVKINKLK